MEWKERRGVGRRWLIWHSSSELPVLPIFGGEREGEKGSGVGVGEARERRLIFSLKFVHLIPYFLPYECLKKMTTSYLHVQETVLFWNLCSFTIYDVHFVLMLYFLYFGVQCYACICERCFWSFQLLMT